MASIKQKDTKVEKVVFRELRRRKVYFQRHYRKVMGTPDVAVPSKKRAVFVDGDFWHGFRYPLWKGRLGSKYWKNKIEHNRARDKKTFSYLRRNGWEVLRVWEHEIYKDLDKAIGKIVKFLSD